VAVSETPKTKKEMPATRVTPDHGITEKATNSTKIRHRLPGNKAPIKSRIELKKMLQKWYIR